MKKKALSIVLAGTMALSMTAVGAVSVSAEEATAAPLAPGGFGTLGEYTPTAGVKTNKLMFAMPGAWQNDTTKDEKCGGAAGIYWWGSTTYDTPDAKAGGHGWPGYKAVQVKGETYTTKDETGAEKEVEIPNLWAIDVPTFGNNTASEEHDASMIIWNNYLDGGMETDPAKNPFYAASQQTRDFPGQYYCRMDDASGSPTRDHPYYATLLKYAYEQIFKKAFTEETMPGVTSLDFTSDNFWVDINKMSAAYNGEDYDKLSDDEKSFQLDIVLDDINFDLSDVFGTYAANFFNEDKVPLSRTCGLAFTFDNMVFVVNFDPDKMQVSPVSGKVGFDGDFYFYYGGGEYGSWPTKELNDAMKEKLGEDKVVSGNFTDDKYLNSSIDDIEIPTSATTAPSTTVPAPATDATSATSSTASGSTTANNSNGAVATGQVSMVVILLVVIAAGIGVVVFTRKKTEK